MGAAGTDFGPQMKARRQKLGFSLREVEAITGGEVSNAYLSQLENGKIKQPSAHIVLVLCAAYAVSPQEAFEWLGRPQRIEPPKICPNCGQAMRPATFAIDGTGTESPRHD